MARNGTGTYTAPANSANPAVAGTTIEAASINAIVSDIETGITESIARDGQTTTTEVIPFAAGISTDTIAEETSAAGVTIDSVLHKDGRIDTSKGTDIASAATTDIWGATGNFVHVTGTEAITSFGTASKAGLWRLVEFDAACTLTHDTILDCPGSANITTAAGDRAIVVANTTTAARVLVYQRKDGTAIAAAIDSRTLTAGNGLSGGGDLSANRTFKADIALGQCRLDYTSATAITLSRFNGRWLFINGQFEAIPSAGVTLANTGLTAETVYYVYAYMDSTTMALEASATAYATDSTYGHKIKNADATRTFVGMVRVNASSQFVNTDASRLVRSYFNSKRVRAQSYFTTGRTTTSTSFTELNTEIRCEFLVLAGDGAISVRASGRCQLDTGGSIGNCIDISGTNRDGYTEAGNTANTRSQVNAYAEEDGLIEGYQYATLKGLVSGGTGTWLGAASGPGRCSLSVVCLG